MRGEFLLHQGQFVDSGTAATVLLGKVHAEESEFRCLRPQFGQRLVSARFRQHIVDVVVALRQSRHGRSECLLFFGFGDDHSPTPEVTDCSSSDG